MAVRMGVLVNCNKYFKNKLKQESHSYSKYLRLLEAERGADVLAYALCRGGCQCYYRHRRVALLQAVQTPKRRAKVVPCVCVCVCACVYHVCMYVYIISYIYHIISYHIYII